MEEIHVGGRIGEHTAYSQKQTSIIVIVLKDLLLNTHVSRNFPVSSPTRMFPEISLQKTGSSNFRPFAVGGIFLGPLQATHKGLDGTGVSPR